MSAPRPTFRRRRAPAAALLPAVLALLPACQTTPAEIFPELRPPLVWPPPPDVPRIRYIGQLTGEASLAAQPTGWAAVEAVLRGPTPKAAFTKPVAVAIVGERVFVVDSDAAVVHVLDLAARSYAAIRAAGDRPLRLPLDIATDGRQLYVVDRKLAAVCVFDLDGRYRRTIGAGQLRGPTSVVLSRTPPGLWVVDTAAQACVFFELDGALVRTIGQHGSRPGEFNFPTAAAWTPALGLVVTDSMNFRVQRFAPGDKTPVCFGRKGDAAGDFALPRDVAVDSEGHIYVLDSQFENVQIFAPDGRLLLAFGQEGARPGDFALPSGIMIDDRDRVWIADTYNRRVQVFQYIAEVTR